MTSPQPDFGRRAASYDRLRPVDEGWWEVFEVVAREADLDGRRVLDVGCGAGRLERALVDRADAYGIDASPEMVAVARERLPGGRFDVGRAEELPFADRSFERAVMWLSVHLVDRPRAFAELARVLVPGGRLAIVSFDRGYFDTYWLNALFPSIPAVDHARFPSDEDLRVELAAAGFDDVRLQLLHQEATLTRDEALERIRGRHISTFDLLPEQELREGTARAERELPETIVHRTDFLLAFAGR